MNADRSLSRPASYRYIRGSALDTDRYFIDDGVVFRSEKHGSERKAPGGDVVAHSPDCQPEPEGILWPEGDLSEELPAIEQLCHLSHASRLVQVSRAGSDPEREIFPLDDLTKTIPSLQAPSRQPTLRTYPIFDRDGKVARMIAVNEPAHQPQSHEPCGAWVVPHSELPEHEPISFCGMIGTSKQMRALFHMIRRVSSSNATILICGESGTGKELVARAVHQCSARRHGAFIPVDCGALPETLLESELFGHVKGAFTGAIRHKKGLFEEAEGGTLFLDEIGDTSLAFQSKLLRALQEGEIRSVGGTRNIKVNIRVVAATNTRLKEAIARKKFREDLYYRLAVMPIRVPPLRERPDDILPLARHFIQTYAGQTGKGEMHLSPDAAGLLRRLPWRGNVRELENVIERAVLISPRNRIASESLLIEEEAMDQGDFPPTGWPCATPSDLPPVPLAVAIDEIRSRDERERIAEAIRRHHGNKSLAARALGIARSSLYNKLKRYKLRTHAPTDPRI
jgi:transcriptional regulator with PAS, ATPase and Fis domain